MSKKRSYFAYMQDVARKEALSKKEWRRIKESKKQGVKNPYRHFIQGIEKYKDIQKITEVKKDKEDEKDL